ncbi:MAG: uracil-DNA glycosylase [Gammaproteobacteria bacterium]|nr:uracil-DNA glycosylase [Gammaproteobacteria bacterium]MBU1482327.1 uracil-DNA glycosylase [Gammaproteobacteria bacterium]
MKEFSTDCRLCPRLASFLDEVRAAQPGYFAQPVPSFGEAGTSLLIVGLAPGMHGANRTGRPFTGDYAGDLLYSTLHKYGLATAAEPLGADKQANAALSLNGCRITNAVRCLPPQNKPEPAEIKQCNGFLVQELAVLPPGAAVMALGTIAHEAVLRASNHKPKDFKFAHNARHELANGLKLYDSYHCSRYNTQTRRLTETMFHQVFESILEHHRLRS